MSSSLTYNSRQSASYNSQKSNYNSTQKNASIKYNPILAPKINNANISNINSCLNIIEGLAKNTLNATNYLLSLKLNKNMKILDEISKLEDNWNDNGANKFSKQLIRTARKIISNFSLQPTVLPTARDSIQMEYEKENGDYIEFELFEGGNLKVFTYINGEFNTENINLDSAEDVFRSFYGQYI